MFGSLIKSMSGWLAPEPTQEERLLLLLEEGKNQLAFDHLRELDSDHGLNLNAKNAGGNAAIHIAAAYGYAPVVMKLLELGAEPDAPNGSQKTPLLLASERGHPAVVKLLLAFGADVEYQDPRGATAIQVAWHPMARKLLEEHIKPKDTALYEHANGQVEEVTILKRHAESEGGGFTIFIPSLNRERSTVGSRLVFPEPEPQPESQSEPKLESQPESQPESQSEPQPEPQPEPRQEEPAKETAQVADTAQETARPDSPSS